MSHTPRCNNVMIVEDDRDIREAIAAALEFDNFRVTMATNGKEALDLLRSGPKQWRPCFILLDLMMPVMNGWELMIHLKSDPELSRIPVMVCSAVADRGSFPGIVDFIKKPIDLDKLMALVNQHCDPSLGVLHGSR